MKFGLLRLEQRKIQDKSIVINYAQPDTVQNIQNKKRLLDITIDTVTSIQTNNGMVVKIDLNKVITINNQINCLLT